MTKLLAAGSLVLALALTGCGANPTGARAAVRTAASSVQALDADHDATHKALNAIVKGVLQSHMPFLLANADGNHDGAIAEAEYGQGRSKEASALFFAQFDTNKDHAVTEAEFAQALAADAPVEAYHHFVEESMSKAIQPYVSDKDFDASELRDYMSEAIALTVDFPLLFQLMDKLDLNQDGKLLNFKGEGPAFVLTFAQPQLQQALGMPTSLPASKLAKKK